MAKAVVKAVEEIIEGADKEEGKTKSLLILKTS